MTPFYILRAEKEAGRLLNFGPFFTVAWVAANFSQF
jgi:hypothetical protein